MPELSAECMQFADMQTLDQVEGFPANCAVLHDSSATSSLSLHMMADISGSKANVLFDSGAAIYAIHAISIDYCEIMKASSYGISISSNLEPVVINTVADTPEQTVAGHCKLKLRLQNFTSHVTFMLLPMHMEYDVLLRDPWLTAVKAQMLHDNEHGCTVVNVHKHGKRVTLSLPNKAVKPPGKATGKPPSSAISVSAVQFKRLSKKEGNACYTVMV